MKNQNTLVAEIHNAFNNAGENLLKEASEIIGSIGAHTIEKAGRLQRAGFTSAHEVMKLAAVKVTRELAELVQYYQQRYPLNKFITEEQVKKICGKYNLVAAPVSRYTGFVPETKLKQIEFFELHSQDTAPTFITNPVFAYPHSDAKKIKDIKQRYPKGIYPVQESYGEVRFIEGVRLDSYQKADNQSMLICAPAKDMDLKGLKKIGAILMSTITVKVPDPVVLQPCKGGFLILAAWGDEASDEIVVNQINN